jgi:glycosyltransferase involved in cell wall biosynthesis
MLTFNRPQFIGRAIESVINQQFQAWELIVVHDGPDQRTREVMQSWAQRDERIRYFHRIQPGNIADATNFGIAQARGTYIGVLDDDDFWASPEKLGQQVQFLEEHSDYVGCGGGAIVVSGEGEEKLRYLKPQHPDEIRGRALLANPLVHSTMVYRTEVARQLGGYDQTLAGFQDWDFGLKLGMSGKLYNFPEYLTYYTMWNGGGSMQQSLPNTRSAIRIVWRHKNNYPHSVLAFGLVFLYYCYALLPNFIRVNSFGFLAQLKKTAFAVRRPASLPTTGPVLSSEPQK